MKAIHCASVFSDHCVLQRCKPIRIWGTAADDTPITVTLNGESVHTIACNHSWSVELPPMEAGGPYTLEVLSRDKVYQHFEDIMIGEVWLAGGQSNMEFKLEQDADGTTAMQEALTSKVRFYQVPQLAYKDNYFYRVEQENHWMLPTDEDLKIWSAVGYYFAAQLADKLNITVGVIGCNWGGTSACAWQDRESILSHEDTKIYWEEYEELVSKQDPEEYEKEWADYLAWHADWQPRMDAYYAEHPNADWDEAQAVVGLCRWPGPMGPKHEFRPCGLYETMLKRVAPYSLAGFIYYQGESDDHRPHSYYHLFKSMIATWRRDFRDDSLPFLCAQLPIHHYLSDSVIDKWCPIRQAQMKLHQEKIVDGIAVILDCGEYNNIHPVHKMEVGRRFALQALHHVYGLLPAKEAYGPIYKTHEITGNTVTVSFDYAEDGFLVKCDNDSTLEKCDNDSSLAADQKAKELTGFELSDSRGDFYPATAMIHGNQIILTSEWVANPVHARYFWIDYDEVKLFGANGLPVAPFHTDYN